MKSISFISNSLLTFFNEYHRIENILVEKNFFNSKEEVFQYIKSKIKDKDLYLIGDGPLLDEFYECFSNYILLI
mgnify:CR=1 FL=1